jgi:hypothetical protein
MISKFTRYENFPIFINILNVTVECSTPTSYWRGRGLIFGPNTSYADNDFMVWLSSSKQISGQRLKFGIGRFFLHDLQFTVQ